MGPNEAIDIEEWAICGDGRQVTEVLLYMLYYMCSIIYYGNINKDTITLSYFLPYYYYIVTHSYCIPTLYLLVPALATGGTTRSQLRLALYHPDSGGQILTIYV